MHTVSRVDIDQDHAELGRGVLHQRPFGVVRAPDADAVAYLQTQRQQSARHIVDGGIELRVAVADALVAAHQGFGIGHARHGALQVGTDAFAQQRHGRHATGIGKGGRSVHGFSISTHLLECERVASFNYPGRPQVNRIRSRDAQRFGVLLRPMSI